MYHYLIVYDAGRQTSTTRRVKLRSGHTREVYIPAAGIYRYTTKAERQAAIAKGFKRPDFRSSGLYRIAEPITVSEIKRIGLGYVFTDPDYWFDPDA